MVYSIVTYKSATPFIVACDNYTIIIIYIITGARLLIINNYNNDYDACNNIIFSLNGSTAERFITPLGPFG